MASKPEDSPIFCRHCGYNLHGLPQNVCPECGKPFDPANRATYAKNAGFPRRRAWMHRSVVLIVTFALLLSAGGLALWWPWHHDAAAMRMVQRCFGGHFETTTVGPPWLRGALGRRGGFLFDRVVAIELTNRGAPAFKTSQQTTVTDDDLAEIEGLSHLQTLELDNQPITDAGIAHLKNLNTLQKLYLIRTQVTDAGLSSLKDLTKLQVLAIDRARITDSGLANLRDLSDLNTLLLVDDTQITDAGLENLGNLRELRSLALDGTKVAGAGLFYLKDLPKLTDISLSGTTTDAGLDHLKDLQNLRALDLDGCQTNDNTLNYVQNLNELTWLSILNTGVTDAGALDHLKTLTALKFLRVSGTKVTAAGMAALRQALPHCIVTDED